MEYLKSLKIKPALWFVTIYLLALSFPLQVMLSSAIPSIFNYLGIVVIYSLGPLRVARRVGNPLGGGRWNVQHALIASYLFLVFFNTFSQLLLGHVPDSAAMSAIAIYALPVTYYFYFVRLASDREVRSVLTAIASVGLCIGIYFAYDSYRMIFQNQVASFSEMALAYSQSRMGTTELNIARIGAGSRSHGPLESGSVSATWILLGSIAALSITPSSSKYLRSGIIALYGGLLLIALNFTSLIGFLLILTFMEFGGAGWVIGRVSRRGIESLMLTFVMAAAFVMALIAAHGERLIAPFEKYVVYQFGVALGTQMLTHGSLEGISYWDKVADGFSAAIGNMANIPLGLVLGDGFVQGFGSPKGGDVGIVETLQRFGAPFFFAVFIGFVRLALRGIRQLHRVIKESPNQSPSYVWFAISTTGFVLFSEIHYSVWSAKSILPIVFFSLALYARYLHPCARQSDGVDSSPGRISADIKFA